MMGRGNMMMWHGDEGNAIWERPAEKIVDVRVRVPFNVTVKSVTGVDVSGVYPSAPVILPILKITPVKEPPTFEIGKRYWTRGGAIAGPLELNEGAYPFKGIADGGFKTWTVAGRYVVGSATSSLDLMPGAIEEEKVDPICVLQGQIDQMQDRIKALEQRADWDGFSHSQSFSTDRTKQLEARVSELLAVNNEYEERARTAERLLKKFTTVPTKGSTK